MEPMGRDRLRAAVVRFTAVSLELFTNVVGNQSLKQQGALLDDKRAGRRTSLWVVVVVQLEGQLGWAVFYNKPEHSSHTVACNMNDDRGKCKGSSKVQPQ